MLSFPNPGGDEPKARRGVCAVPIVIGLVTKGSGHGMAGPKEGKEELCRVVVGVTLRFLSHGQAVCWPEGNSGK